MTEHSPAATDPPRNEAFNVCASAEPAADVERGMQRTFAMFFLLADERA